MDLKNTKSLLVELFTRHPTSVNETYWQHFYFAGMSGMKLTLAGLACMIHSIFPFLFANTASRTMQSILQKISLRKNDDEKIAEMTK